MRANRRHSTSRKARHALVIDDDKFMPAVLGDMLRDLGVSQVT